MSDAEKPLMMQFMSHVKHALIRINPFQVRIFVAMLFEMCSVDDIVNAKDGVQVRDSEWSDDSHRAWANAWQMKLCWCLEDDMETTVREELSWCYPVLAPCSAMRFICTLCQVSADECSWLRHMMSGVQDFEAAMAEKMGFMLFWRGQERFCPLEEYLDSTRDDATRDAAIDGGLLKVLLEDIDLKEPEHEATRVALAELRQKRAKRKEKRKKKELLNFLKKADEAMNGRETTSDTTRTLQKLKDMIESKETTDEQGLERGFGTQTGDETDSKQNARKCGRPIVPNGCAHAASFLNRRNVHMEYNGGYFTGEQRRWANMGIENVNRKTNMMRWEKGGWCSVEEMMRRCFVTFIAANLTAIEDDWVQDKLQREQPEALRDLNKIISQFRGLHDLQRRLWKQRDGLCRRLKERDTEERADMVKRDIRQYMLQFKSAFISEEQLALRDVLRWIKGRRDEEMCRSKKVHDQRQKPTRWRYCGTELVRCQQDMEQQFGVKPKLKTLRERFNKLGYQLPEMKDVAAMNGILQLLKRDEETEC